MVTELRDVLHEQRAQVTAEVEKAAASGVGGGGEAGDGEGGDAEGEYYDAATLETQLHDLNLLSAHVEGEHARYSSTLSLRSLCSPEDCSSALCLAGAALGSRPAASSRSCLPAPMAAQLMPGQVAPRPHDSPGR